MAFSSLNCPAVINLLSQVESDYGLKGLVPRYLMSGPSASELPVPTFTVSPPVSVVSGPRKRVVKEKPDGVRCTGKTAKGEPCKFAVKEDGLCGIHLRQRAKPEGAPQPKKSVAVPKKVAEVPKHTHSLSEEAEVECGLCETQGNVMKPELTKVEFEAISDDNRSLKERLAAILANSDDDPDDTEEVEAPEVPKVPKVPTEVEVPEEDEAEEDDLDEITGDIRSKLAKLLAQDEDEDEEDIDIDQMCETPPSKERIEHLMNKLNMGNIVNEEPMDMDAFDAELDM